MQTTTDVLFDELIGPYGGVGVITLNRQKALNALNHAMFLALDATLTEWEHATHINAVVIRAAEGRAFCAGGDIRHAYERGVAKDPRLVDFFADEYRLNRRIFHFSKPYIALLDGITMGGGAGISMNGAHRVATNRLVFAMPETGIGFFPDVGASYFLARLPHKIGFYLGLTGVRIAYNDCFALGLVEHVIPAAAQTMLLDKLVAARDFQPNAVSTLIHELAEPVPPSTLFEKADVIAACFAEQTVEGILQALDETNDVWCHETAALMRTRSPTSLKVTLRELQKGEGLDFDACMEMEYRMTCQFLQGHDFFEGVRAAIIDKDQTPKWQPARLSDVNESDVARYF